MSRQVLNFCAPSSKNNHRLCVCIGNSCASFRLVKYPYGSIRKPISNDVLIDTVEDAAIFNELKKFDLNIDVFKKGGFSHEQLRDLADILKNVRGSGAK